MSSPAACERNQRCSSASWKTSAASRLPQSSDGIAAIPPELSAKRQAAELFHELLEHRWFLSQQAGEDVGLMPAVDAYVAEVLRHAPDERAVLEPGGAAAEEADDEGAAP